MTPWLSSALTALGAALSAGAAASLMLLLSRLPASTDLLLPRKAFFPFFAFLIKAQSSAPGRSALSWTALALMFAGLLLVLARLAAAVRRGMRTGGGAPWLAAAGVLTGGLVFAAMARSSVATLLDLLQNAWFPPESLDIREPVLAFILVAVPAYLSAAASLSMAEAAFSAGPAKTAGPRNHAGSWKAAGLEAALLAACWLASEIMAQGYGAGLSLAQASGTSAGAPGSAWLLVLTEKEAPDYTVREVMLGVPGTVEYAEENLAGLERFSRRRSLHRLQALMHAYTGRAALADAEGMRASALAALEAGDPLAGLLLLGSLSHAPATQDNLMMLEALADEKRWRVGPHAAFLLSNAFARFGEAERAGYWLSRASQGESGIPAGLLVPSPAARPSKVRGRFVFEGSVVPGGKSRKGEGLRVALYARDRAIPADLSAMALSVSTVLDAKGGFEFREMPAGDYSLALVLGSPKSAAGTVAGRLSWSGLRVTGHKGDIRVEGRDVAVPPIALLGHPP